jgi:hypothetical protein
VREPIAIAVAADDVRHLERGAHAMADRSGLGGVGRGRGGRKRFRTGLREQVQRTRRRADRIAGDVEIPPRGGEAPVPEQKLNRADVSAGFE